MANFRVLLTGVLLISSALSGLTLTAQHKQTPSSDDRDRYVTEIRAYKHNFLTKALDLNKETQRNFFALYDQMEDELMQMQMETRALEQKIEDDSDASNTELEAAAAAIYGQKEREGKLEMEYFQKFKEILTPRQLIKLRSSEKKFNQSLLKHQRKKRQNKD